MADVADKRVENVDGDFFVDESCIDCGTCMWMEPAVYHDDGGMSAVHAQPATKALRQSALRALISCPTASIGATDAATRAMLKDVIGSVPFPVADNVYHCSFHSELRRRERVHQARRRQRAGRLAPLRRAAC